MPTNPDLCGWGGIQLVEREWNSPLAREFISFHIFGADGTRSPERKLWEPFQKVAGRDPDLIPQPTGNCVAASAADAVELLQCIEIVHGDREEFVPVYNPFHYATGRVLIGQNRLRGRAGSVGIWQADAIEKFGVLRRDLPGLPSYNKTHVNDWGNDKPADGASFRDFLTDAKDFVIKGKSRLSKEDQVIDAIDNWYPCTIAADVGFTMKPQGGEKGYHRINPADPWSHQQTIVGYNLKRGWVAIKGQWGDVFGKLVDIDTGEPWPRGMLRITMEDFRKYIRNAEIIAYSNFAGFPAQRFDHGDLA